MTTTYRPLTVSLPMGLFSSTPFSIAQTAELKSESGTDWASRSNGGVLDAPRTVPEMEVWDDDVDPAEVCD